MEPSSRSDVNDGVALERAVTIPFLPAPAKKDKTAMTINRIPTSALAQAGRFAIMLAATAGIAAFAGPCGMSARTNAPPKAANPNVLMAMP